MNNIKIKSRKRPNYIMNGSRNHLSILLAVLLFGFAAGLYGIWIGDFSLGGGGGGGAGGSLLDSSQ